MSSGRTEVMVEDLLTQTEEALARVEHERAQAREAHLAEIAGFDGEIRRLRASLRALKVRRVTRPKRSAAVQAGPKALDKVRRVLASGPQTQAKIVKRTKLNDGTVSYALRALVESGEIVATGNYIGGSREFKLRGRARRAA